MKIVDIILINYNGWKDTIECIDSINESNYKYYNILIIDNNSTDDSVEIISKEYSKSKYNFSIATYNDKTKEFKFKKNKVKEHGNIILICNDRNGGFGYANNIGTNFSNKYLNSEYIWILNNDVTIKQNTIEKLVNFSKNQSIDGFIGGTIVEYYNKEKIQRIVGNIFIPLIGVVIHYNAGKKLSEINKIKAKFSYIGGLCIFSKKDIYNFVGGFDERFFLYSEDIDICMTAKKKNIPMYWCKDAIVYHKGGSSIGSKNMIRKSTNFSEYNSDISMLIYNYKWYPKLVAKFFGFNRYILKIIKFIKERDFEKIKVLNKAYKDFKNKEGKYCAKKQ